MKLFNLFIIQLQTMLEQLEQMKKHPAIRDSEVEKALESARVALSIVRTFLRLNNR